MGRTRLIVACLLAVPVGRAWGQSSSMYHRAIQAQRQALEQSRGSGQVLSGAEVREPKPVNPELERISLIAVKTAEPPQFRLHDIIGVIVREQTKYESDAKLDTKSDFEFETQIDEFFRMLNGHLAAASFTDGRPNIDFQMENQVRNEGDAERRNNLTFRMAVEIVDIKPHGQLVLSGRQRISVAGMVQIMSFTGQCRREDVTPDNTVLSSQVFDQNIEIRYEGAVNEAARQGWLWDLYQKYRPL